MMAKQIASVLEELRSTTDRLFLTTHRFDLNQMELAVADRQRAIAHLQDMIDRYPDSFTREHLENVRNSHQRGKQAIERLIDIRRSGWTTATELSQNQYVLKSFSRLGLPE